MSQDEEPDWYVGPYWDHIEKVLTAGQGELAFRIVIKDGGVNGRRTELIQYPGQYFLLKLNPIEGVDDFGGPDKLKTRMNAVEVAWESGAAGNVNWVKCGKDEEEAHYWQLMSLNLSDMCKDLKGKWTDIAYLSSPQMLDSVPELRRTIAPLPGRPVILCALAEGDDAMISNIVKAIMEALEGDRGLWGPITVVGDYPTDMSYELLREDEPPGSLVGPPKNWVADVLNLNPVSAIREMNVVQQESGPALCAGRAHGDLWGDNLIFAVEGVDDGYRVTAHTVDHNCLIYLDKAGEKVCVEFTGKVEGTTMRLPLLRSFKDGDGRKPIPDPLLDIAQLVASILVSLPFEGTHSIFVDREPGEEKQTRLNNNQEKLRQVIVDGKSVDGVACRVAALLGELDELVNRRIELAVNTTAATELMSQLKERLTLLTIDRILLQGGFAAKHFDDQTEDRQKLMSHLNNLLEIMVPAVEEEVGDGLLRLTKHFEGRREDYDLAKKNMRKTAINESHDVKFVDSTDTYRSAMRARSRPKLEQVHEHKDIDEIRSILSEREDFEVILIKGRANTGKSAQLQQLWAGEWKKRVGYMTAEDIWDAMGDKNRWERLKNVVKHDSVPLIIDDLGVGKTARTEVLPDVTKAIIKLCYDNQIRCVIIARDISAVVKEIGEELKKTMDSGAGIRLQTSLLLDKEGVTDSVGNLIVEHRTHCSSDVLKLMIDKVEGGTYEIGLVEQKLSDLEDGVELMQETIVEWRSESYWLNKMLDDDSDSKITNILAFHRLLGETYSGELPRIFAANLLKDFMEREEWLDRGIKNVYFHDLKFVGSASDDWRSAGMCNISSLEHEETYHLSRNKVNKLENMVEKKFKEMQTELTTQRMKIRSGGKKVTPEEVLDALYELPDAERDATTDRLQDKIQESKWVLVVRGLQRQLE